MFCILKSTSVMIVGLYFTSAVPRVSKHTEFYTRHRKNSIVEVDKFDGINTYRPTWLLTYVAYDGQSIRPRSSVVEN